MTIIAIDFEASCLPRHGRSFPIEVGVASGWISRSWLIRPSAHWSDWDWRSHAEALHGLSRARIERDGLPVEQVLTELGHAIAGHRVVADSTLDQVWLDTLAAAAGRPAPCAIDHVALILEECRASEDRIAQAVARADRAYPMRHHAAADALWLSVVLDHIVQDRDAPMPIPMMACC